MALPFSDDFNRANSNTVGNGWSENESSTASVRINNNRLYFTSPNQITRQSAYRNLGVDNGFTVTGVFQINHNASGGRTCEVCVLTKSTSGADNNGYGVVFEKRGSDGTAASGNFFRIHIVDGATVLATDTSQNALRDVTTDIAFEIVFNTDHSIDVYVWLASGSKPGTPSYSYGLNTPNAAGNNFVLSGANTSSYNADIFVDDILVEAVGGGSVTPPQFLARVGL